MAQLDYYNDDVSFEEFDEDAFWANDLHETTTVPVSTPAGFEPPY